LGHLIIHPVIEFIFEPGLKSIFIPILRILDDIIFNFQIFLSVSDYMVMIIGLKKMVVFCKAVGISAWR
jgi:hypothetical protein